MKKNQYAIYMKHIFSLLDPAYAGKRILALSLCVMLVFGLSACGKGEDDVGGGFEEQDTPPFVYVPKELDLGNDGECSLFNVQFVGDKLYYQVYLQMQEAETEVDTYNIVLRCHSLVQNKMTDLPLDGGVVAWTVGEDGSIYTMVSEWIHGENNANGHIDTFLVKKNSSGEQIFHQEITDLISGDGNFKLRLAADAKGRIYLLTEGGIYLFDENGKQKGLIKAELNEFDLFSNYFDRGYDGKIYFSDRNGAADDGSTLYEVDYDAGKLGSGYQNFPTNVQNLSSDTDGYFLTYDSTAVYRYNLKEQKKEMVFQWSDSGINISDVSAIGSLSNGSIAVVYQDWETKEGGITILSGVDAADIPQAQRREIVVGCIFSDQGLVEAATEFNGKSDDYHISVKNYGKGVSDEDALTRLQADIASGNGPDIIHLNGLWRTWPELAQKGAFEDLMPYLEQGDKLSREEMLDGVIEAYTYNGQLVAIPSVIQIQTYLGSAAQVGEKMGWTIDDVIALSDANPGVEIIDGFFGSGMMRFCLMYSLDTFIDWEQGTCRFDGEEFKKLLEFANRFQAFQETASETVPSQGREKVRNGEVLLCYADLYELKGLQLYEDAFQGQMTAIGCPSSDGRPICTLSGSDPLAISSKSDVKEGCWSFIEYYVTRDRRGRGWVGFPTTKTLLDKLIEKETEYKTDANGNPVLDEDGNYRPKNTTILTLGNGLTYTYRLPNQKEIDMVMDMIQVASLTDTDDQQILSIILEESEAFFNGQKSVDEVADAIQRRVGIYVSENM